MRSMITMRLYMIFAAVAVLMNDPTSGAKILCMFGLSGKSHNHVFTALTTELARRGHEITVVTPFPIKNPPGKYKQIDVPFVLEKMKEFDTFSTTHQNPFQKITSLLQLIINICPEVLQLPDVLKLKNEKFDLVIVSMFFNDCALPFARFNDAPLILISPAGLLSHVSNSLGNPEQLSYVPNLFLPLSDHMSFLQRILNVCMDLFFRGMYYFIMTPKMTSAAQEYFGNDIPPLADLMSNASLAMINNHVSINYPRPLLPNIIEVGGMHIKQTSDTLSKDLEDFIDGAKDGVIYFSMGTVVKPEQFPNETLAELIETFKELPQRIIWKWNLDTLPGQPDNVKLSKWLPQQAILAHPNVRLFITHGGLLSTQESLYHGVPLVGIPVLGDQNLNVYRSQLLGVAEGVSLFGLTKKSLLEAITKVINTPSYKEKALSVMQRIRDQPETPLERAVFWTEYVLRHNGASHLRSAAIDLAWYQLNLVDVAVTFLVFIVTLVLGLRMCCRALLCRTKSNDKPKKKSFVSKSKKHTKLKSS